MEEKKYPIRGFAPGNYICKCVSCKENFMGDKRAVQCEDCATKEEKPYWKRLKEKYFIPLSKNKSFEDATEEEILEWYKKDREQANYLIEKYGSHAWKINELANALRNGEISESHFRELVRYQFEECFKNLNDENRTINLELSDNLKYMIKLQEELQTKMDNIVLGVPVQYFGERNLTAEENKALEMAFKKSLIKTPTLNRK